MHYSADRMYSASSCIPSGDIALISLSDIKDESLHGHDFIEVVFVVDGIGVHNINGQEYPVKAGDCLYINYGCTHSFKVIERLIAYNLMIKVDYFYKKLNNDDSIFTMLALTSFAEVQRELDKSSPLISFYGNEREEILTLFRRLERELGADNVGKASVVDSYVNIILVTMLRKIFLYDTLSKENDLIPERVIEYIKKHCDEKLALRDLSEQCFYNPSYFSRLFKRAYNMTFTEFILRQRLKKSCDLLKTTTLPIEQISSLSGFADKTSFYSNFKATYGCTPGEYRKKVL